MLYDINTTEEDIGFYMKHIIRDCQQEKTKQDLLEHLGNNYIFWIKDWSQKFLVQKFREPQQDYFGKKGMSQQVDVIYLKQDNEVKKYVYFTLLQSVSKILHIHCQLHTFLARKLKQIFQLLKMFIKNQTIHGVMQPMVIF